MWIRNVYYMTELALNVTNVRNVIWTVPKDAIIVRNVWSKVRNIGL